jgi:hypothetical protein
MKVAVSYRLPDARYQVVYSFEASCYADPALFQPWEQLTAVQQDEFDLHGAIPCDGGGLPGEWCRSCRFGTVTDLGGEET